jgi:hypothetical protein
VGRKNAECAGFYTTLVIAFITVEYLRFPMTVIGNSMDRFGFIKKVKKQPKRIALWDDE